MSDDWTDSLERDIEVVEGQIALASILPQSTVYVHVEVERLRRLVQATKSPWQPIETAPKDGTWVLLWWPYWNFRVLLGRYYRGRWEAETAIADADDGEPPRLWMPLPDPPQQNPPQLEQGR